MQRMLDFFERAGNRVPHPVLMFLYLIAFIVVLSHILYLADVQVTEQIAVPVAEAVVPDYYEDTYAPGYRDAGSSYSVDYVIEERTFAVQSLLTTEGIRFMFSSFVSNFQGFGVVAVVFIAILGAGVAEAAGLMSALIRLLVQVAPARLITYIIVLVGVLSSIATDAGYLILIPLGATAFLSLKRHPLAGMAAAFAGVSAAFGVNFLITPVDSMLTEITNEAISLSGGEPISIMANFFFSFGSTILLTIVAGLITERIIEPRLGEYVPADDIEQPDPEEGLSADERKGMWYALFAFLALAAFFALITVPEGAALRDPVTGAIIGPTPFMDSLLLIITLSFLVAGIGYGIGAKTIHSSDDVINAVTKTFAGLSGLVFMLLIIAQFIAYFNFTQMPTVAAIAMADALEAAGLGALPLLIGMILVITVLNIIIPGVVPKWAIFAPVFIPIFIRLEVAPQTVLAAYRVGDSPLNVITPLMVYLPFVVVVAQRYVKDTGLGTVVSLMLPYSLIMLVVWILFFALWFLLGVPLGPGYPVGA